MSTLDLSELLIPIVIHVIVEVLSPSQFCKFPIHLPFASIVPLTRYLWNAPFENYPPKPLFLPKLVYRGSNVRTCNASSKSAISRLYFDSTDDNSEAFVRSNSSTFSFVNFNSLLTFSNSSF